MARVRKRKEGQSFNLTIHLFDEDQEVATPTTARYRIDCLTTGRMVRDWTALTPSSSISILVTPEDNAIVSRKNPFERKQLIVETDHGTDNAFVDEVEWTVENLLGIN